MKMHGEMTTPGPISRLRLTRCRRMVQAHRIAAFTTGITCQLCRRAEDDIQSAWDAAQRLAERAEDRIKTGGA